MRRLAAAATASALAVLAGTARADTYAIVPSQGPLPMSLTGLAAVSPNLPGSVRISLGFTIPPTQVQQLSYPQLEALWQRAGAAYGIPWQVLGAINKIESNWGRNMGPSSAGAIGWMQFMPSTWVQWGMDASGDGVADPWNPYDAVFSAARYLAAAGGATDISRALFAYNHADWYVREVLDLAQLYAKGGAVVFSVDRLQVALQQAEQKVVEANRLLVHREAIVRDLARAERPWIVREQTAALLSDRLDAGRRAGLLAFRRDVAAAVAARFRERLRVAQDELRQARLQAQGSSFTAGAGPLFQTPTYSGTYVFPVGGGPLIVSVGHTHHDYPAADIAAPTGTPVYALTNAVVVSSWFVPDASGCGIGLTMQAEDGQVWTYCHLSYEEPAVQPGVQLTAGEIVGLVGSTGAATGPHLHLQLQPATAYPQAEAWFQSFAGTAFTWQDAPTPAPSRALAVIRSAAPVFRVVSEQRGLILFSRH